MRAVLAFLAGLILLCDLAVVAVHVLDDRTTLIRGPRRTTDRGLLPGPDQTFLTGEVERLTADNAQAEPLASPFTITAVEPGAGRVTVDKALVNGRRVSVSWDGGTPLPISGGAGLELGAVRVEVDGRGIVWSLDGAGRKFLPGTYSVGAPVAVGSGGLASPREGVEFTADEETVLAARGEVVVRVQARRLELQGPGRLEMTGRLEVQSPDRRSKASSVRFAEGPFRLTLEPSGDKLRVDGVLQGPVDVS